MRPIVEPAGGRLARRGAGAGRDSARRVGAALLRIASSCSILEGLIESRLGVHVDVIRKTKHADHDQQPFGPTQNVATKTVRRPGVRPRSSSSRRIRFRVAIADPDG